MLLAMLQLLLLGAQVTLAVTTADTVTYLVTDSQHVTACGGVWSVALGPVRKSAANPLLEEDKPWEAAWWNTEPSIIHDGSSWHLFWNSHFECGAYGADPKRVGMCPHESYNMRFPHVVPSNSKCGTQGGSTCAAGVEYATSLDGIKWTKPMLNLIAFNGSTDNNILISANGTDPDVGFYLDPHEANISRKWKAFGTGMSNVRQAETGQLDGATLPCRVDIAFSASPTEWPSPGSPEIIPEPIIGQNDGTAEYARASVFLR